jgi:sulfite exporter TauE/SafE
MNISIELINEAILSGFLLGLSIGTICMGTCLPVLIPFSIENSASHSESTSMYKFLGKFLFGRFISYLVFGLCVGYMGSLLQKSILNKIGLVVIIVLAVLLMAYGLGIKLSYHEFCKTAFKYSKSKKFPLILGILTGINLCPPFLLAIFYSFERSTTPLFGMIFFMAFFVSTSLFLLPIVLIKYLPRGAYLVKISQVTALIAGVIFIYKGMTLLL